MTTGYAFISIIALVCYVFLLLTFMAAKKSKLIHVFMLVLVCMILWTGTAVHRQKTYHILKW